MRSLLPRRPVAALLLVGALGCDVSGMSSCREDPWADDPANKGVPPNTLPGAPPANSRLSPSGTDHTVVALGNLSVVPHSKLLAFLPSLAGWTVERDPQGETDQTENYSRVQVDYIQNGGMGGLSIEIIDTTGNAIILEPLIRYIRANRGVQIVDSNATGVTPQEVNGFPAKQEWNADDGANNGTLGVLLSGRFTVAITGNSLANAQVMKWAANSIDLKKLAELK